MAAHAYFEENNEQLSQYVLIAVTFLPLLLPLDVLNHDRWWTWSVSTREGWRCICSLWSFAELEFKRLHETSEQISAVKMCVSRRSHSGNVTDGADELFVLVNNRHKIDSFGYFFSFLPFRAWRQPSPSVQNWNIPSVTINVTQTFQSVGG